MLVLWLSGLIFVVSISSASSNAFPRVRLRDDHGRLRSQVHPVHVTAKESPLHINRVPLGKRGRESYMVPRRSAEDVYFIEDDDAQSGNRAGKKQKVQTFQFVLDNDRDDSDNSKRGGLVPIQPYDLEKLLAKLASYQDNVKVLVQDTRDNGQTLKRVQSRPRWASNKKMDSNNKNSDDILAILQNSAVQKPDAERKFKKILLKALPEDMSVYDQKFGGLSNDMVEGIQAAVLKELLTRVKQERDSKKIKSVSNSNDDNNLDRNSLYNKKDKMKKKRAQASPFDSQGMIFITKPKEKREPNLSALIEKVVNVERAGSQRSHLPLSEDFTPDEITRIKAISKAIENDDGSFEKVNESVENMERQVQKDDLEELQKVKDEIMAPKSVRSKRDPNLDESGNYFGKISDLVQVAREDNVDPVFDFDSLVA